jgi:hypothetical protein
VPPVIRSIVFWVLLAAAAPGALGRDAGARGHLARVADPAMRFEAAAIRSLQRRGTANSLAAAALLIHYGAKNGELAVAAGSGALELAAAAAELAPADPAIAWIRVRLCATEPGCDNREAATAMRWLDPDNAAAWLPTLAAAHKDHDTVEVDRVLADMAQGARFDIYWNRIIVLIYDQLRGVAAELPKGVADSDDARFAYAVAVASAGVIPKFQAVVETCREPGAEPARRESCIRVAKNLELGDTVIAQVIGLNLAKRFVAADGHEAHALAERRRVLEWRGSTAGKFDQSLLPWRRNARARWRVARMRALRREQDVVEAILREQGSPVDPPESRP